MTYNFYSLIILNVKKKKKTIHLTDCVFFRITRLPVKTPFIHYSPIHCRTQIEAQLGRGKKWNFWELNYSLFPIQFRRAWNIYSQASKTVNHSTPLLDCRSEPFCRDWKTLSHAPLLVGLDSKSLHLLYRTFFFRPPISLLNLMEVQCLGRFQSGKPEDI